jgi:PKD repeat protein
VYTQAGTYQAVVTVTDPRGKTGTATVAVTVGNPRGNQAPTVQIAANPRRGTAPLKVTFTAAANDPDGDPMLYEWDFGDGGKAGGQKVTHTYAKPGTYTAKVMVDDLKGGKATAEVAITVNARGAGQVLGQTQVGGTVGLRTFMSRGLSAKVTCASKSSGAATLSVSKATARKLGLRSATLASATVKCAKGKSARLRVKPSKAVARLLAAKQPKSVRATFSVILWGKGKAVVNRAVTIKR